MNKTVELNVQGMNCSNCALGIKKTLEKNRFSGVLVDFTLDMVQFAYENEKRKHDAIKLIQNLGYTVKLVDTENQLPQRNDYFSWMVLISFFFTIPLLLSMFAPFKFLHNEWIQLSLAFPVYLIGLFHFGKSAWKSIKSGVANMDLLIITGATASFGYSLYGTLNNLGHDFMFYETSASIISIILLGNFLEKQAIKKTTTSIDALTKLKAENAKQVFINKHGIEEIRNIHVDKIMVNDVLLANAGDKIPIDGEIVWGEAMVDESMVTGETFPVNKSVGNIVIGGTIMLDGTIKLKATNTWNESTLAKIIDLVRLAQQDKPKIQHLADKISSVFVPLVILISVITFTLSFAIFDLPLKDSLLRSIAVLVISCPCALGLAIPTAVIVGVGKAASSGILLKGSSTLEKLHKVDTFIFDKTGTLTTGNFTVQYFQTFNFDDLLAQQIIKSLENHSSHPIAQSILLNYKEIEPYTLSYVKELKGVGVEGFDLEGNKYYFGKPQSNFIYGNKENLELHLYKNNELVAAILLVDQISDGAKDLIKQLKIMDKKAILLSGDKKERCISIANQLGIDNIFYEKKPNEKLAIIKDLQQKENIAMIGDGINDAPALSAAHVSISLGNATNIAIQSADVILVKPNLNLIVKLLNISKLTMTTVKQNLFWAFVYNIIAIPFAALGFLNPMIAAFSMAFSDIFVVGNSLRLKWLFTKNNNSKIKNIE